MFSRVTSSTIPRLQAFSGTLFHHLSSPLHLTLSLPAISLNIPGLFADIWEGVLRAVPKKKTSHMKRRHRQLAGKALKDVKSINSCPACGQPKRAHHLCPSCVEGTSHSHLANKLGTKVNSSCRDPRRMEASSQGGGEAEKSRDLLEPRSSWLCDLLLQSIRNGVGK